MEELNLGLVKAFKDTLEKIIDVAKDFTEAGLDTILEDSLLKELPIVKYLYTMGEVAFTVRDVIYLNKVIGFFRELKANRLSQKDIQKHRETLSTPEEFNKELESVIKYIDSSTREKQVEVIARIYQGYLMGNMTSDVFDELIEVNNRMFVGDYGLIGKIVYAKNRLLTKEDKSAINRLISLGLLSEILSNSENITSDKRTVELTQLGSCFARYLDITRYSESEMRRMMPIPFSDDGSKYDGPNELEGAEKTMHIAAMSKNGKGIFEYELYDQNGEPILKIFIYDREMNNVLCMAYRYYAVTRFLPTRSYYSIDNSKINSLKVIVGAYTFFDDGAEIRYNSEDKDVLKQSYFITFGDKCRHINAYNLEQYKLDTLSKSKTIHNEEAKKLVELQEKIKQLLSSDDIDPAYFSFSDTNYNIYSD